MSLLTLIKAQLGLSNTPANNFTLDASADNGTLKLARGNAGATTQDILTVDAAGKVAAPQGYSDVIGSGQTWQNVKDSRASGTTYTNSTGKPIMVIVTVQGSSGVVMSCTVGGVVLAYAKDYFTGYTKEMPISFIVPAGATYSVTVSTGILGSWVELR